MVCVCQWSLSSNSVVCHFRALVLFLVSGCHVRLLKVSFILTDGSGTVQRSTIVAVSAVLEHRWFGMPRKSITWVRNSLIQRHLLITCCMSGTWFKEPRRTDSHGHCSYSGREATGTAGCGGWNNMSGKEKNSYIGNYFRRRRDHSLPWRWEGVSTVFQEEERNWGIPWDKRVSEQCV